MRDLISTVAVRQLLLPGGRNSDFTTTAADLRGFESANLYIAFGNPGVTLNGSTKISAKITHSDDNAAFTPVPDDAIVGTILQAGTGIFADLSSNAQGSQIYGIGYLCCKRYVRIEVTYTGTHSFGTAVDAFAILGHPSHQPVAV